MPRNRNKKSQFKINKNRICHQLYQFLESKNLESAESLIQSNIEIFTFFDSNNVYTLMLRYYLYCDNLYEAINIFKKLIDTNIYHKRHLFLFMNYYH